MSGRVGRAPRVNPYSARFVEPGAIPYRVPGADLAAVAARLRAAGGWGEVVGPHGSGKSTLLASLLPLLADYTIRRVRLTVEAPTFPDVWPLAGPNPLLVVDGFEQLGWWGRRRVVGECRRAGAGLLATAHRPLGLPPLARTDVTADTLAWVLARLAPSAAPPPGFDPAARLAAHRGSLRAVLFELYDRWEQEVPSHLTPRPLSEAERG